MAFTFDSSGYSGTGQTSASFFSQRHQPFPFNPKIFLTLIISFKFSVDLTNFQ
jgi:hypothetical protein